MAADGAGLLNGILVPLSPLERSLLDAHNAERAKAGLSTLAVDGQLVDVARARARDMATNGYFSHTTPSGETVVNQVKARSIKYAALGENLARNNYPEAQAVGVAMNGFLESEQHRTHVFDTRYDRVGIGTATANGGMIYFVVLFLAD